MSHLFTDVLPRAPHGKVDVVVGLDARGFLLGPLIALRLGAAFVPVRKAGKLPGYCVAASYTKEYGTDSFEMQRDAVRPGQTVVVVDDLIATGGSAAAVMDLVRQTGGQTLANLFVVELAFLDGRAKLEAPTFSLLRIDSE